MDPPHHQSSASFSPPPPISPTAEAADQDSIARLLEAVPQLDSLFNLSCCIGHGTFSSVYLARIKHTTTINGRRHFAIKHIIPTSHPSRVCMELRCLKMIGGQDNVMGVTMCFRQLNHVVLVMPHFPHNPFSEYVGALGTEELREYLVNLLCALRRVHSFRVIHRDVKPANFLYNRRHHRYSLVDFGLAQEVGAGVRGGSTTSGVSLSQGNGPKTSVAITDTPLTTSSSKTVKRKLSVNTTEDEAESGDQQHRGKRQNAGTSPSAGVAGILSSTTSRLNTALRRSPRKKSVSKTPPRKENFEGRGCDFVGFNGTPKMESDHTHEDSPSKHTRSNSTDGGRKMEPLGVGAQRSLTGALQVQLNVTSELRRSPRKFASSACLKAATAAAAATPLEGLAKHLHDASTPNKKGEGSSSLSSRPAAPAHHITPKVSGISFTPDLNGINSKAHRNNRVLQEVQTSSGSMLRPVSCHCYGSAKVCAVCLSRSNQVAPRAGTPGFRAPEVLLRHPDQDTGVDMWSVGVILLSLLSGRYPFFKAADDLSNLAEITTLLGTASVRRAAAKMGKLFKCSEERHPLDLMKVCEFLRTNTMLTPPQGQPCPGCRQCGVCVCLTPPTSESPRGPPLKKRSQSQKSSLLRKDITTPTSAPTTPTLQDTPQGAIGSNTLTLDSVPSGIQTEGREEAAGAGFCLTTSSSSPAPASTYPPEAYHLLMRLLDPSPDTRITATDALAHPFLNP